MHPTFPGSVTDRFAKLMDRSHDARWFVGLNVAVQRGSCRTIHRVQRAQTLPHHIVVKPPVEELKLVRHHGMMPDPHGDSAARR